MVSFKHLALITAATVAIGATLLLAIFVVIASSGVAIPELWQVRGADAEAQLPTVRDWLTVNNALVTSPSLLLFGMTLLGKGLEGLLDGRCGDHRSSIGS